jgi:uncharacterized protein
MKSSEILEVLYDWNFWGKQPDSGIERKAILGRMKAFSDIGEINVVSGVRRCGKSTLLLQLCRDLMGRGVRKEDILIVNLEDPRFIDPDLDLLNKIYETYLSEFDPNPESCVVLDEVQTVQGWERFARYLHENRKAKVFITGSSSKLLSSEYATVLSGRHVDMAVYPLSFEDFLAFKGIHLKGKGDLTTRRHVLKKSQSEYLQWGGFPRVTLLNDEAGKKELLGAYFTDIVIKDVVTRHKIKEVRKLEDMARYYLTNISSLQSFNKIRKILNISLDSAERFSTYLSEAYLVFFVPKFSYSLKEQVLNPKKVYCIDNGLRNAIGFKFMEDLGRLAENAVFIKLKSEGNDIYYWRDDKQREVDFLIRSGNDVQMLVQVAWDIESEETKKRELDPLLGAMEEFPGSEGLVLTGDYENIEHVGGKTIVYTPLWKWLLSEQKTTIQQKKASRSASALK